MYGLHDGIRLLGPLPRPWRVRGGPTKTDRPTFRFFNAETDESTTEDPRLGPLAACWKRIERDLRGDDPIHCDFFRNTQTGEIINYDPRLEPEMLESRGVELTTFSLV